MYTHTHAHGILRRTAPRAALQPAQQLPEGATKRRTVYIYIYIYTYVYIYIYIYIYIHTYISYM